MNLPCIDNHILIWGVRQKATLGQEPMILRAISFLSKLSEQRTRVMIPAVVAGEFLVGTGAENIQTVHEVLSKSFMIVPYDLAAAACAAKIRRSLKLDDLKAEFLDLRRCEITIDCQILATAITRNASVLYTHDKKLIGMAKMAKVGIEVCNIPDQSLQSVMILER